MREVKVGQVWKWFPKDGKEDHFVVTAVNKEAGTFDYKYLGGAQNVRLNIPLSYFDEDSVLIEDVEQTAPEAQEVVSVEALREAFAYINQEYLDLDKLIELAQRLS